MKSILDLMETVKIFNWNMSCMNPFIRRSIDLAYKYNPDVIVLMEVKQQGLDYLLQNKEYTTVFCRDLAYHDAPPCYITFSTKRKINKHSSFTYFNETYDSPFNRYVERKYKQFGVHEALKTTIELFGIDYTFYAAHLSWAVPPEHRLKEMSSLFNLFDKYENTIVAGDFNVYGSNKLYNKLLGKLFGYTADSYKIDERMFVDNFIQDLKLQNPFAGTLSFPLVPFKGQLDHILIPHSLNVINARLFKFTHWSDHRPQLLEFAQS